MSETIDGTVVGEFSIGGLCSFGTGSGVDGSGESTAVAAVFFVSESDAGVGGRLDEGSRGGSEAVAGAGGEELALGISSETPVGRGIVESSR